MPKKKKNTGQRDGYVTVRMEVKGHMLAHQAALLDSVQQGRRISLAEVLTRAVNAYYETLEGKS